MSRTNSSRISTRDTAAPFAALQLAISQQNVAPSHDDGWRSIDEVAAELDVSVGYALVVVSRWSRAGRIEVWSGHLPGKNGWLTRAARYRVKPTVTPPAATKIPTGLRSRSLPKPCSGVLRFAASCFRHSERTLKQGLTPAPRKQLKERADRLAGFEPLDR